MHRYRVALSIIIAVAAVVVTSCGRESDGVSAESASPLSSTAAPVMNVLGFDELEELLLLISTGDKSAALDVLESSRPRDGLDEGMILFQASCDPQFIRQLVNQVGLRADPWTSEDGGGIIYNLTAELDELEIGPPACASEQVRANGLTALLELGADPCSRPQWDDGSVSLADQAKSWKLSPEVLAVVMPKFEECRT